MYRIMADLKVETDIFASISEFNRTRCDTSDNACQDL